MKKSILLLAGMLVLGGCAQLKTVMVDPANGNVMNCEAFGFGWLGVPIAYSIVDDCEKKSKAAGMVTIDEFAKKGGKLPAQQAGNSELKIDSEPSGATVYSGLTRDVATTKIGTTPYTVAMPKGKNAWAKECYKATKEGYFDSPVECFELSPGPRTVKLALSAKQ